MVIITILGIKGKVKGGEVEEEWYCFPVSGGFRSRLQVVKNSLVFLRQIM
jgi:hypothetical protein